MLNKLPFTTIVMQAVESNTLFLYSNYHQWESGQTKVNGIGQFIINRSKSSNRLHEQSSDRLICSGLKHRVPSPNFISFWIGYYHWPI